MKEKVIDFFGSVWRHLTSFLDGVRSIFLPHYDDVPFERVVLVQGINSTSFSMRGWVRHLERQCVDVEVVQVQGYYIHTDIPKVESIVSEVHKILQEKKKTLVIAHSFGGIVARTAIGRLASDDHIILLATLGSPHGLGDFGVQETMKEIGLPERCTVPLLTFGGRADIIVPEIYSHHHDEDHHIALSCIHTAFLIPYTTNHSLI